MDVCKKCSDNFFVNNKYSLCELCNSKYHLSCVSLEHSWIKALDIVIIFWVCDSCVDKINAAVDYVNSEGAQNTVVLQEDIEHPVREEVLLQKLVNNMENTLSLQKEVIASLNDGSLKSNNSAGNVKNNFDKRVMSAPSALTLFYTISVTKNPAVNIIKMNSRSATPNLYIPKPKAENIIQAKDVKKAFALAENSLVKDTNKPSTLKDGYQGNIAEEWTQIVRKKKRSSMRPGPAHVAHRWLHWGFKLAISKCYRVAENWYNPSSLPVAIIPGYTQVAAFCRTSSIHGGTLIFVNYDLEFKIVEIADLCVERHCEFCTVKLKFILTYATFVSVYRPPAGNYDLFLQRRSHVLLSNILK
ncbi:hypothetical protein WA026_012319 [Henosepilachna vigintioctopunctata]|uniref:PHD-type domain-containing protein n=1 Tax=Henosepilachna vigintioctopunctata TaxID=420089 RepID=A0AAW1UPU0_9CUCU